MVVYLLTSVLAIISTVNTSHLKLSAKQLENHRLIWGLIGLGMLTCFVVIRAASFHHFDQFIGLNLAGIRVNNILELGGIGAIAFSALKNIKFSSTS